MTMEIGRRRRGGQLGRIGLWALKALLALVLTGISGGALLAQLIVLHHDLVHVFVLGGLVILAGWLERPTALRRQA